MDLLKGDITALDTDCIVNAANEDLTPGGGVCGAIHKPQGKELAIECKKIGHCGVGEARITNGYHLKAKHVIHTVGPIWHGGDLERISIYSQLLQEIIVACNESWHRFYRLSKHKRTGIYGYPKELADPLK